jgi:transcriptional regulator with XRE-family HTH domain
MDHHLTQEQLADKLHLSHQTISKWETGINTPSIDNLLLLSDLYNIPLDELIRGSRYFQKPFLVGKKMSRWTFLKISISWFTIVSILTGFSFQPWWLFLLLFVLGALNCFSLLVGNYWIVTQKSIDYCNYSKLPIKKIQQIFGMLIKKMLQRHASFTKRYKILNSFTIINKG